MHQLSSHNTMQKPYYPIFCVLLACAAPSYAQAPAADLVTAKSPAMFPFVLPWDDATPGTATDVSFLNAKPAGIHGYIVAKQGHFIEKNTGQRIRFLGANFAGKDAFPSHADAEKVAARVAKLGINLVRLHHMDNVDWGQDASIWNYAYKDRQHISAVQLDKLDYLVAQFKKNGVYVNINLHVSRQFSEVDGFPPSVSQIPFSFDKRVDEFDRRMILLQKNYAHDLLTHVNPYTHLSYAADPAVAVVEINNENSLVGDPWATSGDGLDTLPEPFRGELVGFWNDWLLKKYGTDTKVQAAWTAGITPDGTYLLSPSSPWSLEHQGTSQAEIQPPTGEIASSIGSVSVVTAITQTDGTAWHVQVHQTGLDLHNDTTYTVTFRAKADKDRILPVGASLDQDDWRNLGLDANAALTTDWKPFSYVFTAHDTVPSHARLAFTLGGQTGTVWIDNLQIRPGADGAGLQPGQSLTTKSVDIPTSDLKSQHDDWIAFLADTERGYADEMRGYLKDTLKVHANIICSQISWGGLTGLNREANMDFADNHAYWQHPSFPHKQWDPNDWNIPNTPMVADLADGKPGTLRDLAEYRVAGKPYTISEYNHPAPNDYRAETLPELATFAAFQDWDAIYLFDYGAYGTGASNDKINNYFGIGSDPAKAAFLPAAAMIFRAGELPKATSKHIFTLQSEQIVSKGTAAAVWHQTGVPLSYLEAIALPRPGPNPDGLMIADGRKREVLAVSKTPAGALYTADSPTAQSVVGYVGGQTVTLGTSTLVFPAFGNNFASVTLTAMDQKPTAQSQKLLLTLVGKVENQEMGWNANRTSVGNQWGHGPTIAEGIPATVTLK
ncbi:MAG: carbohydrate binding domain-containing protein, partial [Janthinobacterium lividum]